MSWDWANMSKTTLGMGTVLTIVIVFLLLLLYVWHKDSRSKVDLTDLICKDGKIDEKKFTRFGAWLVSTWGFTYMIIDGKFTEWYFMTYMGVWTGNAILDKYLSRPVAPAPAAPSPKV
jgi:hypothetical protein